MACMVSGLSCKFVASLFSCRKSTFFLLDFCFLSVDSAFWADEIPLAARYNMKRQLSNLKPISQDGDRRDGTGACAYKNHHITIKFQGRLMMVSMQPLGSLFSDKATWSKPVGLPVLKHGMDGLHFQTRVNKRQ